MNREDENERFAGSVPNGIPVFAHAGELESDGGARGGRGDGDFFVSGQEGGFGDALGVCEAVDLQGFAAGVAEHVFFPAQGAAVGAEGLRSVGGEVAEAEVVVGHGEHLGRELLVVRLTGAGDVAGAPAGVDGFPVPVVDLHRVPGVVGIFCRHRCARCEGGGESESFAVAAHDHGLEASFAG